MNKPIPYRLHLLPRAEKEPKRKKERSAIALVIFEQVGPVATITLNRPEALNALNRPMRQELDLALQQAAADDVRAVVLTGAGRAFSVGQDVAELKADYDEEGPQLARLIQEEWGPLIAAVRALPKPVVAAVNGPAAGGGLSLALAADIRLAEPKTSFLAAFVKVGLVPDSGAAHMLIRMLGLSKAMQLVLTADPLGADEALRAGLVAAVAPDVETMQEAARDLAKRLASGAPLALAAAKAVMHAAADAAFGLVVAEEARQQDVLGRTEDHREAIEAFLAKRPPTFQGR
jgi:2-(1,2-epoxy-1,2-dihydrophenyl)acetyl-CoA isomerase